MFLVRGALLVVSWRANSNKSVSVRKAPGRGLGVGRKLEGNKRGMMWIIHFTERMEMGSMGLILFWWLLEKLQLDEER